MCVGIVFEMPEIRFGLRDQALQEAEHVALYVRVGVLVYGEAAGCVLGEEHTDAVAIWQEFFNIRSYLDHLLTITRLDRQGMHGSHSTAGTSEGKKKIS